MRNRCSIILAHIAIAAMLNVSAMAEGIGETVQASAIFETEIAFGTATNEVQKFEFILAPEVSLELTESTSLTFVGRLRGDLRDELEPGQPADTSRSDASGRLFIGDHVDVELREAFVDTNIGDTYLRVGKQQVVWGQADGLKVLDVLNPQSFREFILDDFEHSRIPLWMINAEIPLGNTLLQLLWIPDKTYDDIPQAGALFAFSSPAIVPALPPEVPVTIATPSRPDRFIEDSDIGAKLSTFVGGWDLSLNYAYHYFDRPVIRRERSLAGLIVRQEYERTHLAGGTVSTVFGDFTLRGEIGYSSDRYFLTDDITDRDGVVRSGELSYVLGLDYQGWTDWFISGQVFQSIVSDSSPGLVRSSVETSASFLMRRNFMNESLQAEALLIQSIAQGDGLLQAKLGYEWRSNLRLTMGGDFFYGTSKGLFGQFEARDRVSLGFELGF